MNRKLRFILLAGVVGALLVWVIGQGGQWLVMGLTPAMGLIVTPLILIGVTVLVVFSSRWMRRHLAFTPEDWFCAAFVGLMVGAIYSRLANSSYTFDIQLHDTYFVIAHMDMCLWLAVVFGAFGLFYHYNRRMGYILGMIHFWLSFLGSLIFVWPIHFAESMPRRYMDYSGWVSFYPMGAYGIIVLWLLLPGLLAQLVFLVNVVYSMVGGRKSVD